MNQLSKSRFLGIGLILVLLSACGGQHAANSSTKNAAAPTAQVSQNATQSPEVFLSAAESTVLANSQNAQIAGDEVIISNTKGVYEVRIFYSVFPKIATQNVKTDFVVEGVNIPADAQLVFDTLTCDAPTHRTETTFNQKCTMGNGTSAMGRLFLPSKNKLLGERPIQLIPAVVEPLYTGNLPDTGITSAQCYGAGSSEWISCTSAAAIALNSKQDGMIGRDVTAPAAANGVLGFSYSDVPKPTGGVYAKTECVKDNITGLTWEGKPTSGLRSNNLTYTNYDSTTKTQKSYAAIPSYPTQSEIDAATNSVGYKNYVNSIALCGYTDWRLPTVPEFDGLMNIAPDASYLDDIWFPNRFDTEQWTSTDNGSLTAPFTSTQAWMVVFGYNIESTSRDVTHGVRLVRGSVVSELNRYSYINNGIEVLDSKTKLIWKRCAEGRAWNGTSCIGEADAYTPEAALVQASMQTGWRLPNRKELVSIIDFSNSAPFTNNEVFHSERDTPYLTSTPVDYGSYLIWEADLNAQARAIGTTFRHSGETRHIRLVRNAP
jgi:hypothetical protein